MIAAIFSFFCIQNSESVINITGFYPLAIFHKYSMFLNIYYAIFSSLIIFRLSYMATKWCVKVTCLPELMSNEQLAVQFKIEKARIDVPHKQSGPNYYAWINGFVDEHSANQFVTVWNNIRINSKQIKCKISQTKQEVQVRASSVAGRGRSSSSQPDRKFSRPFSVSTSPTNFVTEFTDTLPSTLQSTSEHPKPCPFGDRCYNNDCSKTNHAAPQQCIIGVECKNLDCPNNHPPGRSLPCAEGINCDNSFCTDLHSSEWDPDKTNQNSSRKQLKTMEQRHNDRAQAQLPIFTSRDEFCRRLKAERILVVKAETGSGKSTQLPQYAAEQLGGLVVCTQPRVLAAISLARRVADEYDGTSVGKSVGYQVSHREDQKRNYRVPGTDIVFMTDSALIHEIQQDRLLSKINVLIIDEAHERSLNTDIVLGMAKLLLQQRPLNFYVVIASATINADRFLKFFDTEDNGPLIVSGRIFSVSLEYMPLLDTTGEDHLTKVILEQYKQHSGHMLVFLPGQRDIEKAIRLFETQIPEDCVALPLFGSLSPEEQDQVLQFDEGSTGERRMVVFCTNIAETSLTIKNVRVVIDSGLVKEAHFDTKRRLTVIKTVLICKSSADQRKGRAGRVANGHCVRLYNEEDLKRTDVEPEILALVKHLATKIQYLVPMI